MIEKTLKIAYNIYKDSTELDPVLQKLVEKAKEAANQAYAPYSHFKVGAAVLLENGEMILGNNQENAAYPSGLCAERVALFYANARFPDLAVKSMAIVAMNQEGILPTPVPPCGACRQVLVETESRFKSEISTYLIGKEAIFQFTTAQDLLPFTFNPVYLKRSL